MGRYGIEASISAPVCSASFPICICSIGLLRGTSIVIMDLLSCFFGVSQPKVLIKCLAGSDLAHGDFKLVGSSQRLTYGELFEATVVWTK